MSLPQQFPTCAGKEAVATIPPQPATILLIEESPCLRDVLAMVIRRCGYRVLTTTTGDDAVCIAEQSPAIDLLLMPLDPPKSNRPEQLQRVHEVQPEAHILFMTKARSGRAPTELEVIEQPFIYLDDFVRKVRSVLHECEPAEVPALAA